MAVGQSQSIARRIEELEQARLIACFSVFVQNLGENGRRREADVGGVLVLNIAIEERERKEIILGRLAAPSRTQRISRVSGKTAGQILG